MLRRNMRIRNAIKSSGLKQWMIAERYGVSEQSFSRMLRYEMTPQKQDEVLKIISDLSKELQIELKEAR